MRTITLYFFLLLSNFIHADTIPTWKVFLNSKLLKEFKLNDDAEEIKIDTLNSKREDYLEILYNSLKPSKDYIYDILVESETPVDLKLHKPENAKIRTESNVELFFARIDDKTKPIRISFEWLVDWLKEYPQYRIQVILIETNRKENHYSQTKLFNIVNK